MAIHNFSILNLLYNCINNNKHGVGNCIHVPNTDPFSYYRPPKIRVVEIIVIL